MAPVLSKDLEAKNADILRQAHRQLLEQPKLSSAEAEKFMSVMKDLWELSDRHRIALDTTSFVVFGPQSAGKTSLIERRVGFVLGCVAANLASRRPLVITTVREATDSIHVWEDGHDHGIVTRTEMHRLLLEMNKDTGGEDFSSRRIYVRVSGPALTNMRLVDLPGYQLNGNNRKFLTDILRAELADPNTVVLALGTAAEYNNQTVLEALRQCGLDERSERIVHCLHRGDEIWATQSMADSFTNFMHPFVTGIGRVPLIVGNTAKLSDQGVPLRRKSEFHDGGDSQPADVRETLLSEEDVNAHLRQADDVERSSMAAWLERVEKSGGAEIEAVHVLKEHFMGRENLDSVISGMVIRRDMKKLTAIKAELRKQRAASAARKEQLEKTADRLKNPDSMLTAFVVQLINTLREVMYPDSGNANVALVEDAAVLEKYGMTLEEEELEFLSNGNYDPERDIAATDLRYSFQSVYRAPRETIERFADYISDAETPPVDLHDAKMYAGAMFKRLQSSWSAHMYRFNQPNRAEDTDKLINLFGFDPEMDSENLAKRAKRLAELYCNRLRPAVQFYVHRVQWIMGRMFDANWLLVERDPELQPLVDLFGADMLHDSMRAAYMDIVSKIGEGTYIMVFSDLDSEIMKLFPFQRNSPTIVGLRAIMPAQYAQLERTLKEAEKALAQYESELLAPQPDEEEKPGFAKKVKKKLFGTKDVKTLFGRGAQQAIQMLQAGSSNPLAGISDILLTKLQPNDLEENRNVNSNPTDVAVQFDHNLKQLAFGFACALYANCLPRFLATVNSRMTANMWACTKDKQMVVALIAAMKPDVDNLRTKEALYQAQISVEQERLDAFDNALAKVNNLQSTSQAIPGPAAHGAASRGSGAAQGSSAASTGGLAARMAQRGAARKRTAETAKAGESFMEGQLRACSGATAAAASPEELSSLAQMLTDFRNTHGDAHVEQEAGDGNCFYRAVARQLAGGPEAWALVKRGALATLQCSASATTYGKFLDADVTMEAYVARHSKDGEYADNAIINAAADFLGREIEVYPLRYTGGAVYTIGPKATGRPVRVVSWTEVHFDSLMQGKGPCPATVTEEMVATVEAQAKQEAEAAKKTKEEAAKNKAAKKKKEEAAKEEAAKKKKEEAAKKEKEKEEPKKEAGKK